MKKRILAVIVLYKCAPENSASFQSLLRARALLSAEELELTILLHDNAPSTSAPPPELPNDVLYSVDPTNSGIANAYNRAILLALDAGCDWLLTLDQDTNLPDDALRIYCNAVDALAGRPEIAAIVPQIRAQGQIVSPNYFALGAWPRWFPPGYVGVTTQAVFAFNSASLLRVATLRQVGGYSSQFWLDNSDSFLYRQLAKFGKRVYIDGRLEVNHDFSMMNMQQRVTPDRYRSILQAESAFWDLEMNFLARCERILRLFARVFKHQRRHDSPELRKLTHDALTHRLFRSRSFRIAQWNRIAAERTSVRLTSRHPANRLVVSVCMAACNGERFIRQQLQSILPQLAAQDEVIIVDDGSTDRTVEVVAALIESTGSSLQSPGIQILRYTQNRGVVKTFEEAIRSASGDILFLADQDDLWAPDKVQKVLDAFAQHPDAEVVATNFSVIDEQGRILQQSPLRLNRKFSLSLTANFLHNQFQGAALAIRASFVQQILPFPAGRLFLHDRWIGARALLRKANIIFLDEPLLLYRDHGNNYTRRFSRWKQVLLRLQLFSDLLRLGRQHL